MIDEFAMQYLHDALCDARSSMLAKLDGLGEYAVRRPMTPTGTNLLGLIKHLSKWEAYYLGEVFDRPFPEPAFERSDPSPFSDDFWAEADEKRDAIIDRFHQVCAHSDTTIDALPIDAPGHVPF